MSEKLEVIIAGPFFVKDSKVKDYEKVFNDVLTEYHQDNRLKSHESVKINFKEPNFILRTDTSEEISTHGIENYLNSYFTESTNALVVVPEEFINSNTNGISTQAQGFLEVIYTNTLYQGMIILEESQPVVAFSDLHPAQNLGDFNSIPRNNVNNPYSTSENIEELAKAVFNTIEKHLHIKEKENQTAQAYNHTKSKVEQSYEIVHGIVKEYINDNNVTETQQVKISEARDLYEKANNAIQKAGNLGRGMKGLANELIQAAFEQEGMGLYRIFGDRMFHSKLTPTEANQRSLTKIEFEPRYLK